MRDDVERITLGCSGPVRSEAAKQADAALARWFDSDLSFGSLQRDGLGGVLGGYREKIAAIAHEVTQTVLGSEVAVASALRKQRDEIGRLQVYLTAVAQTTLAALLPAVLGGEAPKLDVPVDVVQVKKTIWDRLLLRSQASVRRRVLGRRGARDPGVRRRRHLSNTLARCTGISRVRCSTRGSIGARKRHDAVVAAACL